jgi:hypothetical protein
MKKIFLLMLVAMLGFVAVSCERTIDNTNNIDNTVYSQVYDLKGMSFVKSSTSNSLYGINKVFTTPLYNSDVVLIYRQDGTSSGNPIWKLLPKTYFLTQGELDYTFDFTKNDIQIYANSSFDMSIQDATFFNTYLNNQTFRVVVIPAEFGKSAVDYNDYNAVIKHFNIDDTKVKTL